MNTGVDKIIWDGDTLRELASLLRTAASALEENDLELRRLRAEEQTELCGVPDGLIPELWRLTDRGVRLLDEARERASGLAGAMRETVSRITETEAAVRRMMNELATAAADGGADIPAGVPAATAGMTRQGARGLPPNVQTARIMADPSVITPDWLAEAADRFF